MDRGPTFPANGLYQLHPIHNDVANGSARDVSLNVSVHPMSQSSIQEWITQIPALWWFHLDTYSIFASCCCFQLQHTPQRIRPSLWPVPGSEQLTWRTSWLQCPLVKGSCHFAMISGSALKRQTAFLKSVSLSIQLIIPKFPLSNDMIVYLTQISFQFPKFLFFSRGLKSKMVDIFFVIPAIIHHVFTAKMYLSSTCLECRKQGSRRRAWSMYYETVVCPVSMYTYRKYILKCTN